MTTVVLIVAFFMGLTFGRMVATNAGRMKTEADRQRIGDGIAACDHCGHRWGWRDTIPLVSYLWLRGRCRYCQHPIGARMIWLELAGGVLFVIGTWLMGQLGWWG